MSQPPGDRPPSEWAAPSGPWQPASPSPSEPAWQAAPQPEPQAQQHPSMAPPPGPTGPPTAWGAPPPGPGWAPPPVKPGIVALRPLGVGEVLDGAIAAVRTNPRTILGLSAVVVLASTALQFFTTWVYAGDLAAAARQRPGATAEDYLAIFGDTAALYALTLLVQWIATTVLGGVLAVAVGRAVIGEHPTPRQAWAAVRPVVWQLLGVTLLAGLVVAAPVLVAALVVTIVAVAGAPVGVTVALGVLLGLAAALTAVHLGVRLALSAPVLVLESASGSRRVGVRGALRRSATLVRGAWWRTFGLILLVAVIATVAAGVVATPFAFAGGLLGGGLVGEPSVPALLLQSLGALIGGLLTTPFNAAATTLIYVDRRMRREGLDIELARAAGVALPAAPPAAPPPPTASW